MPPELAGVGAPLLGWRVLPTSLNRQDLVMVGAPAGDGQWFLGQLIERDGHWDFTVHGPITRYPSKAERRAGLELRWPPAAENVLVGQVLIDVINTSAEPWIPTPLDHFHTVGILVAAGASTGLPGGYAYAYGGGQPDAFILDRGEYTRVHVTVASNLVIEAGLGRHSLYAAVPALSVVSEYPLSLTITEEDLKKGRATAASASKTKLNPGTAAPRHFAGTTDVGAGIRHPPSRCGATFGQPIRRSLLRA